MDSPCIKQTVCKVLKIFQYGKYLVAYVPKNGTPLARRWNDITITFRWRADAGWLEGVSESLVYKYVYIWDWISQSKGTLCVPGRFWFLAHLRSMDLPTLIRRTIPFTMFGVSCGILRFPNFTRTICKQTVNILIRNRFMRCLIWVCTVNYLCPLKRKLGLYGLTERKYFLTLPCFAHMVHCKSALRNYTRYNHIYCTKHVCRYDNDVQHQSQRL